MHDAPSQAGSDWARFRPGPTPGLTLMQAHFTAHSFERHSHPTYSVGVTQSGVQTFRCRGAQHASTQGDVILFNPDEPHDGSRGTDEGFGYSMLYIEPALMRMWLGMWQDRTEVLQFRSTLVRDTAAATALLQAIDALGQAQESLRAEALTSGVLLRLLQRYAQAPAGTALSDAGATRMARVRDQLEAGYAQDLTVDALARQVGLSRVHMTRAFARHFGVPPHVYLNAVRLRHAQHALLAGQSLADTAMACGFADQSHFTRRFKGSVGVTPGAWARQMRQARG